MSMNIDQLRKLLDETPEAEIRKELMIRRYLGDDVAVTFMKVSKPRYSFFNSKPTRCFITFVWVLSSVNFAL